MSDERQLSVHLAVPDSSPLILRRIPPGYYRMGSANSLPFAPEGPEHTVAVKAFWMADSPVTASQYEALMGHNPSQFRGQRDLPVETVSWFDAREFCDRLSQGSGVPVRFMALQGC